MLYPIFNQRMKYKNIFLTGSTGVVGKPLLKKLINEGHNVYALSRNKINDKFLISNNTEIIDKDIYGSYKNESEYKDIEELPLPNIKNLRKWINNEKKAS